MSVEFEEQYNRPTFPNSAPEESGMVGFLIKSKLVKNREQALLLLMIFGIVLLIFSGIVFYRYGKAPSVHLTAEERAKIDARVRQIESGDRITN